ncbi:MAG: hypothetical protein GWO02_05155 [Gammaproteobacteria bacterium]|nr:hypothetical protein [Gammaproteobacteria bacterium]
MSGNAQDLGEMTCPNCGELARVRRNRKQRFYLAGCDCGNVQPRGEKFQERVLREARFYSPADRDPASSSRSSSSSSSGGSSSSQRPWWRRLLEDEDDD